jgi:Skp family chaperone for outer membrane proteins
MSGITRAFSLVLAAGTLGAVGLHEQAPAKLAYVNSGRLMEAVPGRAEIEAELLKRTAPITLRRTAINDSAKLVSDQLAKDSPGLAGTALADRQKKIQDQMTRWADENSKLLDNGKAIEETLVQPLMDVVNKVLSDFRAQEGYSFIFDTNVDVNFIVAADKNLDVTDQVLAKIRLMPKVAIAPATVAPAASGTPGAPGAAGAKPPASTGSGPQSSSVGVKPPPTKPPPPPFSR